MLFLDFSGCHRGSPCARYNIGCSIAGSSGVASRSISDALTAWSKQVLPTVDSCTCLFLISRFLPLVHALPLARSRSLHTRTFITHTRAQLHTCILMHSGGRCSTRVLGSNTAKASTADASAFHQRRTKRATLLRRKWLRITRRCSRLPLRSCLRVRRSHPPFSSTTRANCWRRRSRTAPLTRPT